LRKKNMHVTAKYPSTQSEMVRPSESPGKYIYFDNAATTFPKPAEVISAVTEYMTRMGGNPGRSGHALSIDAGGLVFSCREAIARLFGGAHPMRVIFCSNATEALNLAIQGILKPGDHAVTTAMEHNSTIRPLKELEKRKGIGLAIVPCPDGLRIDLDEFARSILPNTRLAVVNHASNVTGTLQPLRDIGRICRQKNIRLLADCSQSAGIVPLDMDEYAVDILAFSGHKGLYGPTGTGGLVLSGGFDFTEMDPLKFGGTGSDSDRTYQPDFIPDAYESGTLNVAGISGLNAGVRYILSLKDGVRGIYLHKRKLVEYFIGRAGSSVKGFVGHARPELIETGVVSFNIEGMDPSDVAYLLSDGNNILCRSGLHCAPLAHRTMGTFPVGTVRFSFGIFNTKEEVDLAIDALIEISFKGR
jgi:cysteine desulfurase/selenocysteine lyase